MAVVVLVEYSNIRILKFLFIQTRI